MKAFTALIILTLTLPVLSGELTFTKATGYFTDKLLMRNNTVTVEKQLENDLQFLVVKLEYKIRLKDEKDSISISDRNTKIKCGPTGYSVKAIAELYKSGTGASDPSYIRHYNRDNGKSAIHWPIFAVSKKDKKFILELKGCKAFPIEIDQSLQQEVNKQSATMCIKSCKLEAVKEVDTFTCKQRIKIPALKKYQTELTQFKSSAGQLMSVTLKVQAQGDTRWLRMGESVMSLRDNKTGSILPFIIEARYVVNPSITKNNAGKWPDEQEFTLLFQAPKNCQDLSILYFGKEIAMWKK
ncbi:MAG: hypothetical protein HRT88_10100 [Lentisphaeraceae bacterium]|nr:hypothetical protein [Lentisphaeraceae bacterium]